MAQTDLQGAFRPHPLAELFPLIEGQAYWDLVADIREHGIREPVVMLDGMVLDGRNRYLAGREAGVAIPTVNFEGDDPLAFVLSLNLTRRHLTESQRAMVAAKLARLPQGARTDLAPIEAMSQPEAAERMQVSRTSLQRAVQVQERGAASLVASVETGAVTVAAAAEVAKLPEPLQVEIVEQGPVAVREAAAQVRSGASAEDVQAVVAGAMRAGRTPPKASRKNPLYAPDPNFGAMLTVCGSCRDLSEIVDKHGVEFIAAGFSDPVTRERDLGDLKQARDNINLILEAAHVGA